MDDQSKSTKLTTAMKAAGPLLTSAFVPLAQELNVRLQKFTLGNAFPRDGIFQPN